MLGRPVSPLILLILQRNYEKLKESMDLWITNRDKTGRTALLYAVSTAFKEAVPLLLPYEADIRDHDGNGVRELCNDPEILSLLDSFDESLESSLQVRFPSPRMTSPPVSQGKPASSLNSSLEASLLVERPTSCAAQKQPQRSPSTELILDTIKRPVGVLPASSSVSQQNVACAANVPSLNQSYILRSLQLCTNAEMLFGSSSLSYSTAGVPPDQVRTLLVALKAFSHVNVRPYSRLVYLESKDLVVLLTGSRPGFLSLMARLYELKAQQAKFTDFELTSLFITLLSVGKALFETFYLRLLDLNALIHPCNIACLGHGCFTLRFLPLKVNFQQVMLELGSNLAPSASFKEGMWNQYCLNITSSISSYVHMDLTSNYVVGFHISHADYPALSKTISSLLYREVPRDVAPRTTQRTSTDMTHRRSFLIKTGEGSPAGPSNQTREKDNEAAPINSGADQENEAEPPCVCNEAPALEDAPAGSAKKNIIAIDINAEPLATDLMLAAATGDLAGVVKAKKLLRLQDSNGHTALMYAAAAGHLSVICLLLADEADITDNNGNGPEDYASSISIKRRIMAYQSNKPV